MLEELEPLRAVGERTLCVRIIAVGPRHEPRLDLREFVNADKFQGFTRKGVTLDLEAFELLLAQADRIRAALEGRGRTAGDRTRRAEASP